MVNFTNKTKRLLLTILIFSVLLNPLISLAANPNGPGSGYGHLGNPIQNDPEGGLSPADMINSLKEVAETNAGYAPITEKDSFINTLAKIVKTILSLLGILFLILIIISGFQWMTAGGNEETIAKARKRIINASIGLGIVILSYSIASFITYILSVV